MFCIRFIRIARIINWSIIRGNRSIIRFNKRNVEGCSIKSKIGSKDSSSSESWGGPFPSSGTRPDVDFLKILSLSDSSIKFGDGSEGSSGVLSIHLICLWSSIFNEMKMFLAQKPRNWSKLEHQFPLPITDLWIKNVDWIPCTWEERRLLWLAFILVKTPLVSS